MERISSDQILARMRLENPWWDNEPSIGQTHREMRPRAYFELFLPLVRVKEVRRAVVLMGPRRVGKTVMILHTIQALIDEGFDPKSVCYLAVDHPIYTGLGLENLLEHFSRASTTSTRSTPIYIFFDEIQYLRNWEVHLKSFVDAHPNIKAVVSGSAAAALKLKSTESGAGRFTDFLLPPLTFYEHLQLLDESNLFDHAGEQLILGFASTQNIDRANKLFLDYLNFGGYPEALFSPHIQNDLGRFIKNDIIDKVLLRDLPSLYGIQDIQELNYLFTTLAFNTANEISLEELSQSSGVAKNTIKKYIEYLEAAFLIKVVRRVDQNAKRFLRSSVFKAYLMNPSMRAALFSPVSDHDAAIGPVTETAVWSQWFHGGNTLYYAGWRNGEVDIVSLRPNQKIDWAVEVKWSDSYTDQPRKLRSLINFCKRNKVSKALVTSKTVMSTESIEGIEIRFVPASMYCYAVGHNLLHSKHIPFHSNSALPQ